MGQDVAVEHRESVLAGWGGGGCIVRIGVVWVAGVLLGGFTFTLTATITQGALFKCRGCLQGGAPSVQLSVLPVYAEGGRGVSSWHHESDTM